MRSRIVPWPAPVADGASAAAGSAAGAAGAGLAPYVRSAEAKPTRRGRCRRGSGRVRPRAPGWRHTSLRRGDSRAGRRRGAAPRQLPRPRRQAPRRAASGGSASAAACGSAAGASPPLRKRIVPWWNPAPLATSSTVALATTAPAATTSAAFDAPAATAALACATNPSYASFDAAPACAAAATRPFPALIMSSPTLVADVGAGVLTRPGPRPEVAFSSLRVPVCNRSRQPPIGARGFAPQNSCVPSIPIR